MNKKHLGLFKKPIPYESDGHRIKTHQFADVRKDDGSIERVDFSIEDVPEESVNFEDVNLQHLYDSGIDPHGIRVQPDSRLGGDSEFEALANMAREHASEMFEK